MPRSGTLSAIVLATVSTDRSCSGVLKLRYDFSRGRRRRGRRRRVKVGRPTPACRPRAFEAAGVGADKAAEDRGGQVLGVVDVARERIARMAGRPHLAAGPGSSVQRSAPPRRPVRLFVRVAERRSTSAPVRGALAKSATSSSRVTRTLDAAAPMLLETRPRRAPRASSRTPSARAAATHAAVVSRGPSQAAGGAWVETRSASPWTPSLCCLLVIAADARR